MYRILCAIVALIVAPQVFAQSGTGEVNFSTSSGAAALAWNGSARQGQVVTYTGCSYLSLPSGTNTVTPAAGSSWSLLGCQASTAAAAGSQGAVQVNSNGIAAFTTYRPAPRPPNGSDLNRRPNTRTAT